MKFWLGLWCVLAYAQMCDLQTDARRHAQEAREDARMVAAACRVAGVR